MREFNFRNNNLNILHKKGRPAKNISGKEVYELISKGRVLRELAQKFGCHRDTIYARFSKEIRKGRRRAQAIENKRLKSL